MIKDINPYKLFLIDGLGAFLTAFMLGVVLYKYNYIVGIPKNILQLLAIIPISYAIYSISCSFLKIENWRPYLKRIAVANILYCLITFSLIIFLFQKLTLLGILYFIGEIIIIMSLVYIEFKKAST